MSRACPTLLASRLVGLVGCGASCPPDRERQGDLCVDDFGAELRLLRLPPPPRSGFRIVVPPRTLRPGEAALTCHAWPFPELRHKVIYAGRLYLYTTPGLHHSNVFARPVDSARGPNPYPRCHPGATDPFRDLPQVIPDALFGNSTQVEGTEALAFPPGMGYRIDTSREIITNFHVRNATAAPLRVEVAYDFFTMPSELLAEEAAPFQLSVTSSAWPPGSARPWARSATSSAASSSR